MDYLHLNTSAYFLPAPYVTANHGVLVIPFNNTIHHTDDDWLNIQKDGRIQVSGYHFEDEPEKRCGQIAGWTAYNPAFQWLLFTALNSRCHYLYDHFSDYVQEDRESPQIKHMLFEETFSWGTLKIPSVRQFSTTSHYRFSHPGDNNLQIAYRSPHMIDYYYALYFTFKDNPMDGLPHFLHLLYEFIVYDERLRNDEYFDNINWNDFDFEAFTKRYSKDYNDHFMKNNTRQDSISNAHYLRNQSQIFFYKAFYDTKQELINFIKKHYPKQTLIASEEQREVLKACPELDIDYAPIITKLDLTELMKSEKKSIKIRKKGFNGLHSPKYFKKIFT